SVAIAEIPHHPDRPAMPGPGVFVDFGNGGAGRLVPNGRIAVLNGQKTREEDRADHPAAQSSTIMSRAASVSRPRSFAMRRRASSAPDASAKAKQYQGEFSLPVLVIG